MKIWVLFALLLAPATVFADTPASADPPAHAPLGPAPAFHLLTTGGTIVSDSLRGRVILLDFWASWCGPCKQSFPWLKSLQETYGPRGLTVVAINLDKDREKAEGFLADHPNPFTVAFDPVGETAEAYKVTAIPFSFLINRQGAIVYSHAGFDPKKTGELESRIEEACQP